jgi:type II secretory pathway predicted ATPase ExeA
MQLLSGRRMDTSDEAPTWPDRNPARSSAGGQYAGTAPYLLDQGQVRADTRATSVAAVTPLQQEHAVPIENRHEPISSHEVPSTSRSRFSKGGTLEIYTEYFGLNARPFTLVPDPDFLFWSPSHKRAYAMLEYGIVTCAPITLITGEVGSGKTTILHHLLKKIDTGIRIGLVSNAQGPRGELLRWVLMALDQKTGPEDTYVDLFEKFQLYLIDEYARGNRVVIIFDEAQNLGREALEELRMFTNINSNKDELLQLGLVGQPELRDMVRRPDLRQFAQRVVANFHLEAMDSRTVQAYIQHRLQKAGATKSIFNRPACELVYENTGGIPRLVNQLCDLAMVYTFTNNQKIVTARIVQQVLDDGAFFGAGAYDNGRAQSEC